MSAVDKIKQAIGINKVIDDERIQERYPHIWKMDTRVNAKAIILPTSTKDVSAICKICNELNQKITIHGGLTNLVGSTVSKQEDIIVSLEKLDKIIEIDEISRTISVEAGVILESIQAKADEHELLFPLNFGAKGTAQIGGCISSNAGGMRVIKYGMTRDQVLGIEAVLPDGTIISSMKKLMKDNTGYDLKHLLIGSEGTIGIITKAVLRLREKPRSRNCAFIGLDDYNKVTEFLKYIDSSLGGKLSCFELMWQSAYEVQTSPPSLQKPPLPYDYTYYILIESLGAHPAQDYEELKIVLEEALETELILDAAIAHTADEIKWFFTIREDVSIMISHAKENQQFDISLPIRDIGPYVNDRLEILKTTEGISGVHAFGHLGDGNIHFIVLKDSDDPILKEQINKIIYEPIKKLDGSISAEHGIGLDKKSYLQLSRSAQEIMLMKTLKKVIDPNNILNPGRIFSL